MEDLNIQILKLKPIRIASAYGFGPSPEEQAWQKLNEWAKPKGLLDDCISHPVFGFNNPNPSPGNPKYGYEFWVEVGTDIEPEREIRIVEFTGGMYAVARCEVEGDPGNKIPATWQALIGWWKKEQSTLRTSSSTREISFISKRHRSPRARSVLSNCGLDKSPKH